MPAMLAGDGEAGGWPHAIDERLKITKKKHWRIATSQAT
jgi:hypothetical protein